MREDVPGLLRGESQEKARRVAEACSLFEDFLNREGDRLEFRPGQGLLRQQRGRGDVEERPVRRKHPACALELRLDDAANRDVDLARRLLAVQAL